MTTKPRQRAPRREPDLEAVVDAAVESLMANGERGFRIEHIIEKTGISRSSLYLHFTDRDGLVEVASMEIFFKAVAENIARTVEAMDAVDTPEKARALVRPLYRMIVEQDETVRWNRVMVLAASRYRERLLERLVGTQTAHTDRLAAAFERWRELGLLKPGIDPREAATFVQVNTFGRVIRDLDSGRSDNEKWLDLMVATHLAFIA